MVLSISRLENVAPRARKIQPVAVCLQWSFPVRYLSLPDSSCHIIFFLHDRI
jgi:hypothetical protein